MVYLKKAERRIFMSKVWLVTGSASGLGRNIAEAVLASGDRLVATARDPRCLEDLVKKYGDPVRTALLDVTDEDAAYAAVQAAADAFGRLDVVVNNAGYGDIAPFEQLSSERFQAVVDTNFYGVVHMTRAALPIMRKQKSGCILQISSVGGRLARPGSTLPSGLSGDSPSPSLRKWLLLASRCAHSNAAECERTGALGRTKTHRTCSRIMNRPWALWSKRCSRTGATRRAIRSRWLSSSFVWLPAIVCLHIFFWAVTPFSSPGKPRQHAPPMQNAGERRASRPTSRLRGPCLLCDSEWTGRGHPPRFWRVR